MVMNTAEQSVENMDYVQRLLEQKQPGFAALLKLAASLVERDLCGPVVAPRNVSPAEVA